MNWNNVNNNEKFTVHFVILNLCFNCTWKKKRKCYENLIFCSTKTYICLFSLRSIKTNESKRWIKMLEFCEQKQQPLKSFNVCCGGKTLEKNIFQASTFSQESFTTKQNSVSSNSTWNCKILQFSRALFHFYTFACSICEQII